MNNSDGHPSPAHIIITGPSSPDEPSLLRNARPTPRFPPSATTSVQATTSMHAAFVHPSTMQRDPDPSSETSFARLLKSADLPPAGPAYFSAQRALWRAPGPNPPRPTEASVSRRRLEHSLDQEGAVESEQVWEAGLGKVWNGLISGVRLKKRLPLSMVVKIVQAGWIRDGTWPKGGAAPDSDDVLEGDTLDVEIASPLDSSAGAVDTPWGATTPWSPETETPGFPDGMGVMDVDSLGVGEKFAS